MHTPHREPSIPRPPPAIGPASFRPFRRAPVEQWRDSPHQQFLPRIPPPISLLSSFIISHREDINEHGNEHEDDEGERRGSPRARSSYPGRIRTRRLAWPGSQGGTDRRNRQDRVLASG